MRLYIHVVYGYARLQPRELSVRHGLCLRKSQVDFLNQQDSAMRATSFRGHLRSQQTAPASTLAILYFVSSLVFVRISPAFASFQFDRRKRRKYSIIISKFRYLGSHPFVFLYAYDRALDFVLLADSSDSLAVIAHCALYTPNPG